MNMLKMMQKAKEIQAAIQELEQKISSLEAVGKAGGGLVQITLQGKGVLKEITIDPSLLKPEEGQILEDLILAAHNEAQANLNSKTEEMAKMTRGSLSLPTDLKLPL